MCFVLSGDGFSADGQDSMGDMYALEIVIFTHNSCY